MSFNPVIRPSITVTLAQFNMAILELGSLGGHPVNEIYMYRFTGPDEVIIQLMNDEDKAKIKQKWSIERSIFVEPLPYKINKEGTGYDSYNIKSQYRTKLRNAELITISNLLAASEKSIGKLPVSNETKEKLLAIRNLFKERIEFYGL